MSYLPVMRPDITKTSSHITEIQHLFLFFFNPGTKKKHTVQFCHTAAKAVELLFQTQYKVLNVENGPDAMRPLH